MILAEQNINKNPGHFKHHNFTKEGRKMQKMQEMQKIAKSKSCKCSSLHARHLRIHGILNHASGRTRLQHLLPKQSISAKLRGAAEKADPTFQHHGDWFTGSRAPRGLAASNFRRCSVVPQASHLPSHTIPPRLTTTTSRGTQARESGYAPRPRTNPGWKCMHLTS